MGGFRKKWEQLEKIVKLRRNSEKLGKINKYLVKLKIIGTYSKLFLNNWQQIAKWQKLGRNLKNCKMFEIW